MPAEGIVALAGAEVDSTHRFRVPYILTEAAEADTSRLPLTLRQHAGEWELTQGTAFRVVVQHAPFLLTLWAGNTVQATINGRGLFAIEHLREKKVRVYASDSTARVSMLALTVQEGDPAGWWEEEFKSHKDTKPRGPQAISIDLDFPAYHHVYGIPEHASPLSLRPTVGALEWRARVGCPWFCSTSLHWLSGEDVTSEPYRLYNLDVFEYVHDSPFSLYGSVPFMLAHNAARTIGAFWYAWGMGSNAATMCNNGVQQRMSQQAQRSRDVRGRGA